MNAFPIEVTAEILPRKVDPSATAGFTNGDRAARYALELAASGDYASGGVWLTDANGRHRIENSAPTSASRPVAAPDLMVEDFRVGDILALFRQSEDTSASPLAAQDAIIAALELAGLTPCLDRKAATREVEDYKRRGNLLRPQFRRRGRTNGWM